MRIVPACLEFEYFFIRDSPYCLWLTSCAGEQYARKRVGATRICVHMKHTRRRLFARHFLQADFQSLRFVCPSGKSNSVSRRNLSGILHSWVNLGMISSTTLFEIIKLLEYTLCYEDKINLYCVYACGM